MIISGYIVSAFLGLVFGSFAGAQVWRLRARQLEQDKKQGEEYDRAELKRLRPLLESKTANDRSRCLHCHHTLAWYDLIPLASWLSTGGKCRYCKKPIGRFEPLMEVGTAALFIAFYHYWVTFGNVGEFWIGLLLWMVMLVLFVILFAYDFKWFLLPDVIMLPLIGLSLVYTAIGVGMAHDPLGVVVSTAVSVGILSGIYLALWLVSRGAWVGFGDVKLGLALGLLLMDWQLAFVALVLANLIGTVIVVPGLISGKLSRETQVPFGPLLIAGFFIALFWGQAILNWYNDMSMWLTNTMLML